MGGSVAMINSQPVQRRTRWDVIVGTSLAILCGGALYHGRSSSLASAALRPALPVPAETRRVPQSVQPQEANADTDVGPGTDGAGARRRRSLTSRSARAR
jgi:hypothetical protein